MFKAESNTLIRAEGPVVDTRHCMGNTVSIAESKCVFIHLYWSTAGRVRPSSVPTALPAATWRQVSQHEDESLYHTMEQKLRTKWFFTVKNAFNAFDPLQRGTVSREALYRILCNTLERGATRRQYADLLERWLEVFVYVFCCYQSSIACNWGKK